MRKSADDATADDFKLWRMAVVRARNKVTWWLNNYGQSDSRFPEVEKAERRRDLKSLKSLEDHLVSAENFARYGNAARHGGKGERGD